MKKAQKYIVRSPQAGTYFTEVVSHEPGKIELKNARLIYYWSGAKSLLQIAMDGINKDSKVTITVPSMTITSPEIRSIPCSDKATSAIEGLPEWKQ